MTAALIIATGKRSGRDAFLPGAKVGTISAIARIVLLFQQAGIKNVVVCGEEEEVKKLVPSMNVVFLPCSEDGQMLDHIQRGIRYLQPRFGQILVCHVDIPLFSIRTVESLLNAAGTICVPAHNQVTGHPILLRSECFDSILSYHGDHGLKGAILNSGFERAVVEVEDPGILADAAEEAGCLPVGDDMKKLRLGYQLRVGREMVFYGPGVHQLLQLTEELQSLSEACKYMGISYSKGRKIIQTMGEQLNDAILVSQQGGKGGGYSQLTETAKDMVNRYDAFSQEAEGMLQSLFTKHFDSIIDR